MDIDFGLAMDQAHLATVEQLIQASFDRGLGFQEIAADVTDEELARLLRRWSGESFRQAEQLGECVASDHARAAGPGTWLDGWRRIWLSARAAVNVGDHELLLCELERAEESICKVIEAVLAEARAPALVEALRRQLSGTEAMVDRLRELRRAPLHIVHEVDTWAISPIGGGGRLGGSELDFFHEVPAN